MVLTRVTYVLCDKCGQEIRNKNDGFILEGKVIEPTNLTDIIASEDGVIAVCRRCFLERTGWDIVKPR